MPNAKTGCPASEPCGLRRCAWKGQKAVQDAVGRRGSVSARLPRSNVLVPQIITAKHKSSKIAAKKKNLAGKLKVTFCFGNFKPRAFSRFDWQMCTIGGTGTGGAGADDTGTGGSFRRSNDSRIDSHALPRTNGPARMDPHAWTRTHGPARMDPHVWTRTH
jgi:hypothetical protein